MGKKVGIEHIQQILSSVKVPLGNLYFLPRLFTYCTKASKGQRGRKKSLVIQILTEEYDGLSRHLDETEIQESCVVRNNLRSRRLAMALIDAKGELQLPLVLEAIHFLKEKLYSLGPQRHHDSVRQEHILRVLESLNQKKELRLLIKKISKPHSNRLADELIRDTLQLEGSTVINDAHARMAVLAAWMCYLRQNVGSCFATAPAILVQSEQPELFLLDMYELLGTAKLKRTFGGVEYTAPISRSWGAADLKKPFLATHPIAEMMNPIWKSPGLILAFTSVGYFEEKESLPHKTHQIKEWLVKFFSDKGKHDPYFILTAEEIIRKVVLDRLQLTEQDLTDYENRPRGMIHSGLLMQTPVSAGKMGGKGQLCAKFFEQFETASKAFKALTDNALLKTWEFTVASFAEVKANFAKWNLYSSLGLGPQEEGGIGNCLYQFIKKKLDQANAIVKEHQEQCEQILGHVRYLEGKIRRASSEQELHWLKIEWQNRAGELHHYEELRDTAHRKAQRFADLFNVLIELYLEKFPLYFQEVYDADMHDVTVGPYDDSPAGFRLMYKAGRAASSSWMPITNPSQFVDALSGFFVMTETEIVHSNVLEGLDQEFSDMVTAVVSHIKTKEFLETAFNRMAIAHQMRPVKDPLENLDKVEKKPWVYTSGGTMNTLVASYYSREESPAEVARWVDNESELIGFFIDTLKQMPFKVTKPFLENGGRSLLIHSPTHAFLLKPGFELFKQAWTDDSYTYTWIRDYYMMPRQRFVEEQYLDRSMMLAIIELLKKKLPKGHYQHLFHKAFEHPPSSLSCPDFRSYIVDTLATERGLRWGNIAVLSEDEVDSTLYNVVPLFPGYQMRERVEAVLQRIPGLKEGKIKALMRLYEVFSETLAGQEVYSAKTLRETCLALFLLDSGTSASPVDLHKYISRIMQKLGYAMPEPFIFADTNWVKDYFGFVVSPGSCHLELWRLDNLGISGTPMSSWKQWINGSRKDRTWGIYNQPQQYKR